MAIIVLLAVVFPGVLIYADCPHCYNLIEVEITLADGTSKKGYIGYYGAYSDKVPLIEGNDIRSNIIGTETTIFSIQFYENVYFFKDIIFGARQEDINEINSGDIEKVIFISKTAYGGAGYIPVLSNKDISLLSGEIYDVRKYSNGCYDVIYVNCNPAISSEEFDLFFEFLVRYGEPAAQQLNHPQHRFKYLERSEGNLEFIQDETETIQSEIFYLSELIDSLETMNQRSLVVKYIGEFYAKYELVLRLSEAFSNFLSSEDNECYVRFEKELVSIFSMIPETQDIKYEVDSESSKWDNIKPLFDMIRDNYDGIYSSLCLKMFDDCSIVYATLSWD